MKAAVRNEAGAPEVLRIADVPDPIPSDTDLLVSVEAISLEGGDLLARRERTPGPVDIIGYAAAGEVLAVGGAVRGFSVGQKVATFGFTGSHAEKRAVPASAAFAVPDALDIGVAAAIPCGPGTAAWALSLGNLQAGQTVLVTGATGGVGNAVVQLAAKAGARVIGTGTNAATLDQLRRYGLSDAVVTKDALTSEAVRDILGGNKVDLFIDNVGGPELIDGLQVLKDGGTAVIVGVFGGRHQAIDSFHLLAHRQTVIGCFLGPVIQEPPVRALIGNVFDLASKGEFEVPVDKVFPFAEIAAAHRRAEERGRIGRVIVRVP